MAEAIFTGVFVWLVVLCIPVLILATFEVVSMVCEFASDVYQEWYEWRYRDDLKMWRGQVRANQLRADRDALRAAAMEMDRNHE